MPVHPHLRFGIGAMPIRAIILPYPNARFRGDRLFSNGWAKPYRIPEAIQILTRWASGIAMSLTSRTPLHREGSASAVCKLTPGGVSHSVEFVADSLLEESGFELSVPS
jgi:hypothetical protein